jgi:LPS sulfotransferase NodH
VICANPRSGSYWLCELFELNGFGSPSEHLRPGLTRVARNVRGFQILRLMRAIWAYGEFDDGLSTKVIYKFAREFFAGDEIGFARRLSRRLPIRFVHLHRRNMVAQALSGIAANKTTVWRAESANARETVEQSYPDYDFELTAQLFDRLAADAEALNAAMTELGREAGCRVMSIVYEDLQDDTEAVMRAVCAFLGRPVETADIDARLQKIAPKAALDHERRFREEFAAARGLEAADVEARATPRTVAAKPNAADGEPGVVKLLRRIVPRPVKQAVIGVLHFVLKPIVNNPELLARQDALFELFDQRISRFEAATTKRIDALEAENAALRAEVERLGGAAPEPEAADDEAGGKIVKIGR